MPTILYNDSKAQITLPREFKTDLQSTYFDFQLSTIAIVSLRENCDRRQVIKVHERQEDQKLIDFSIISGMARRKSHKSRNKFSEFF